MSVEPYSSFEFVKPADYLESFDKAANLGAWDDAEKQAKINAKVRVQNGKIYDKVIDNAYKLAPTLAKLYEQKRDKEEQVGRNEAVAIATKLRALGGDHNSRIAWEKDDNIHRGETSWMENMADEAEAAGKSDFAESLRNLHGRREVWVKEALAINHANQYRFNLEEGLHGGYNIPNPNIDGETIGIDNWEDQAELQSLVADWEIDKEYTEIAGLSSEFLHKHYLPAIEKQRQAFFEQQAYSRTKSNKESRKADYYEQIKLAGSDSQPVENLVEKLIDVSNNTSALYGGPVQSKVAAINSLDQMLADGEISREKYLNAMDVMIPNKGKQGKLERFGDVWKQHFGNWEDRIAKAEQKAFEAREVQHENRRKSFTSDIQEAIQEAGGDWTEDDVKFWSKSWSENPANVGIKPPEILNTLANDTVEDRADDDYVATMQANLDMGNPVGDGWRRIKDANLKKEWAQIASSAAGSGLSSDQKSFRDAQIGRWATAKLGETYGVEGQTGQWGKIQARGKVIYDKHFRKAYVLFPDDPGQRHQWALDETEKEIASTSIEALTKRPEIDINAPGIKLKNALNSIKTNKDNKINIITSGIIEGTEKDFEQVLKFAKNPVAYSIPSIYYQIAQKIRFKKKEDGKILTGWDIANYQHIAQTGQELPKPGWRKTMDTYSPAVQYFLQVAPSYKRKEQARILHQENGDFSKPEYTLPGVTATALQELGNK